jgi:hypothetical protein
MNTTPDELKLGVGVAAFGHDASLGRTLTGIDAALAEAGIVPVARVVSSADGSGQAEPIATEHGWSFRRSSAGAPRGLAAAREAARRACGGDAQLLVDGDVELQAGWIAAAVEQLRAAESLAGVGGAVDEAHWAHGALLGGRKDVDGVGAGGPRAYLRDAALWRRSALDLVGGFDPWLPSEDEAELAGRLAMAGFGVRALGQTIAVRHGTPRDSFADVRNFLVHRAFHGPALVLVRSRGAMAFGRHLARHRGGFALLLWALVGLGLVATAPALLMIWMWATLGGLAVAAVLTQSLPRAFFRGLRAACEALSAVRALGLPIGLPRLGLAPRPLEAARPGGTDDEGEGGSSGESGGGHGGIPFRVAPRDPDEPPPLVANG